MNKVFNINLGGYPFTIDEDAYSHLTRYLETIEQHFQNEEGVEEIVSDIEFRMAELFNEQMKRKQIVTFSDVDAAIAVMGTPEEFGADSSFEETNFSENQGSKDPFHIKTGKKLYRDEEEGILGGVAAGLSAYFGIDNPLWVRLAFIFGTITGGVAIPLYFIFWLILPAAKTASDRLAMRGEKINVSNIAKTIGDEMNSLSEKISDFGEGLGSKKKSFGAGAAIKNGSNALKNFIASIFKVIAAIWRPIALIIGIIALIALAIAWISMIVGFTASFPYVKQITSSGFLASLGVMNLFFVIGVPLLTIISLVLKFAFNNKIGRGVIGIAWGIWFLNVVSLGIVGAETFKQFNQYAELTDTKSFVIEGDVLKIERKKTSPESLTMFGHLSRDGDQFYSNDIRFDVEKTDGEEFIIEETYSARGRSSKIAQKLANGIQHELNYSDGVLTYGDGFALDKKTTWKNQQVRITIKVPQNKSLFFNRDTRRHFGHIDIADGQHNAFYGHYNQDSLWVMRQDGLACDGCSKRSTNGRFKLANFTKVIIDGKIKANIERSNDSELYIKNHYNAQDFITHEMRGDSLIVKRKDGFDDNIRIYIKTPFLDAFEGQQTDDVAINGFNETSLAIKLNSYNELRMKSNIKHLDLDLQERSRIKLTGRGNVLRANLTGKSKIDGDRYRVSKAHINALDASYAELSVKDTLHYKKDEISSIDIKNSNPVVVKH